MTSDLTLKEQIKNLPEEERTRLTNQSVWAILLSPTASSPDYIWDQYCDHLRDSGIPDFIIDRVRRPHEQWKEKRKARRHAARKRRKGS